ncbi:profilin [Aplysia californica]|uniref:Profilin n=1 Tax=Aplysia californica TaxID=6500 RepID=A0ABM1ACQ5_APLCA|nr:profilin [Aplysia californica]
MANAWQAYVDHMLSSGIQMGGIYGQDGNVWAASPLMKATPQEVAAIVSGLRSQSFEQGVHIGGQKYTVIRFQSDSVTAKCRTAPQEDQKYLLHACLGKTCVLIGGICGPAERDCTKKVEDLRDYLAGNNI